MKAIALLSGGLDSTLAIKSMLDQGIEVIALNFISPFCLCDGKQKEGCGKRALDIGNQLKIDVKFIGIYEEYLQMIQKPRHGYGRGMNPCIDCRILILKKAKEFMQANGADFVVTGEVLGQRPMSQNKNSIDIIEKESGLEGYIVRPLSAKAMKPSIPEEKGWIDREKLWEITGRGRRKQLDLVEKFNITGYGCPAGGCLLADINFSLKIKDLMQSNMLNLKNIEIIKRGRYFNINQTFKLIVGRDEAENNILKELFYKNGLLIEPEAKGPVGIGIGELNETNINHALNIIASYCKKENEIKIGFTLPNNTKQYKIINDKMDQQMLDNLMLLKGGNKK